MNMGGPDMAPHSPHFACQSGQRPDCACYTLISQALDPDEDEPVVDGPHGEAHAVAHAGAAGVDERRLRLDRHQLHGAHAQRGDGIVPHQDHPGGGAGDKLATHLVRGRTEDGAPDADGEGTEQGDEERGQDQPAAPGRMWSSYLCPACGSGSINSTREG